MTRRGRSDDASDAHIEGIPLIVHPDKWNPVGRSRLCAIGVRRGTLERRGARVNRSTSQRMGTADAGSASASAGKLSPMAGDEARGTRARAAELREIS